MIKPQSSRHYLKRQYVWNDLKKTRKRKFEQG